MPPPARVDAMLIGRGTAGLLRGIERMLVGRAYGDRAGAPRRSGKWCCGMRIRTGIPCASTSAATIPIGATAEIIDSEWSIVAPAVG